MRDTVSPRPRAHLVIRVGGSSSIQLRYALALALFVISLVHNAFLLLALAWVIVAAALRLQKQALARPEAAPLPVQKQAALLPTPVQQQVPTLDECAYCHILNRPCGCKRPKPAARVSAPPAVRVSAPPAAQEPLVVSTDRWYVMAPSFLELVKRIEELSDHGATLKEVGALLDETQKLLDAKEGEVLGVQAPSTHDGDSLPSFLRNHESPNHESPSAARLYQEWLTSNPPRQNWDSDNERDRLYRKWVKTNGSESEWRKVNDRAKYVL